jgi:UDP-glucose 4-epimerase
MGRRESIEVFGTDYPTSDGTCVRDYIHVEDLASAHRLAVERVEPGRWMAANLGPGEGHSVRQVIGAAEQVTQRQINAVYGPRRPGDPPSLVADASHAREVLGWHPQWTRLDEIIASAWRWHQAHPEGYND